MKCSWKINEAVQHILMIWDAVQLIDSLKLH